ncbi:sensor histidine kinase [Actinomadura xylanilytica]|uniref:sensor histidine kinase n=1 Tax=Actinomadura xylanilytica TaxID=887459 RepID=UPI00255A7127|nr:histidine kinase [Actinomadura xylanilytica]MDL4777485.1 histidine kinase [Actinomadura xylanilytica]
MDDTGARVDRIHFAGGCLARVAYLGCAGLYLLLCLAAAFNHAFDFWLIGVAVVVTGAAVSVRHRFPWAVGALGASALTTLFIVLADPPFRGPSTAVEVGGLLVLIVRVLWREGRERLIPVAVALSVTIVVLPLRASAIQAVLFVAPLGVLVAVAIGIGLYLRAIDTRRARALVSARRDERLELARDLHDFVAHHVTGIVVQAQAARFAAGSGTAPDPEQLDTMFAGIEQAGTEALTSMRRMVGLLRDAQNATASDGDAGRGEGDGGGAGRGSGGGAGHAENGGDRPPTSPVGDLAQVESLVAAFGDPPASLWLAPDLGGLPPEVATSVHRVVQEALTNIRKHAADATAVQVTVARRDGETVEVAVRDDGQGRGRRLPSSGFGLSGLGERVEALGGRLAAGPRSGGGWEVTAVLPARRTLRESDG